MWKKTTNQELIFVAVKAVKLSAEDGWMHEPRQVKFGTLVPQTRNRTSVSYNAKFWKEIYCNARWIRTTSYRMFTFLLNI